MNCWGQNLNKNIIWGMFPFFLSFISGIWSKISLTLTTVLEFSKSLDRNLSFWQVDRECSISELDSMARILVMFSFCFLSSPFSSGQGHVTVHQQHEWWKLRSERNLLSLAGNKKAGEEWGWKWGNKYKFWFS